MAELVKDFPEWFKMVIVIIPIISLFVAAGAFILNLRQTILNNRVNRSKIISDTLHAFMDDETIQTAFYKIEYGKFEYSTSFHGSAEEKEIDKLLRHYSNLAMMWKNGLLTLNDIYPIQYYVMRITQNSEVTKYFEFMEQWTQTAKIKSHPFLALSELGKKLEKNTMHTKCYELMGFYRSG